MRILRIYTVSLLLITLYSSCHLQIDTDNQPTIANAQTKGIRLPVKRFTQEKNANDGATVEQDILVDSLVKVLNGNPSEQCWQILDSLACISDGYKIENISEASIMLWQCQFRPFIIYLTQHPKNCLRQMVVFGMSEELSVIPNRIGLIDSLRRSTTKQINNAHLTGVERLYCEKIIAEVRPEMFD